MSISQHAETQDLKPELEKLLQTLKNNRDKVPLQVLKSKYKTGYDALCKKISHTASEYAKQVSLHDIRIHKDYLEEGVSIINQSIEASGLLKELSKAAFLRQDITEFTSLAEKLRGIILESLDPFYGKHTGLYLTAECLENPEILPEIYCLANGCIWRDGQWIPLERIDPATVKKVPQESALSQTA